MSKTNIDTWKKFAIRVRAEQEKLLVKLDDFDSPVLVTGCQRSGGTMLARVITGSDCMTGYRITDDDELDAALILSSAVDYEPAGRHCFQTTYLNERYKEYIDHPSAKIIWSLRNPYSVVYSMAYNWKDFALNELFVNCGLPYMNARDRVSFQRYFVYGVPRIRRAAYAFCGKVSQLFYLSENIPSDTLAVVEYDNLVRNKTTVLPQIYSHIDADYREEYAVPISERSLNKQDKLKQEQKETIESIAMPVYEEAMRLITIS